MADRSTFKNNLKYHRIIVLTIGLIYIYVQYEYSSGDWSYTNGQAKIEGQHVNGKDEGIWTWYYANGKKQMQGPFLHGKRNGIWTVWDANGNKITEDNYENDKLNGKFTRWYQNGAIQSEGFYSNDSLKESKYYNEDGSLNTSK